MKNTLYLLAALFVAGCSSISVVSDYDKTYDFEDAKTAAYYGWADGTDKILSPFDKERIEKAFAAEFAKRGVSKAAAGDADLVISLHIVTEQKQQTTATTTGMGGYGYGGYYGYGPGYGWGGGMATTTYDTYDYTEGTLLVSVYDAKQKRLVWESAGKGTVEKGGNTESREARINQAVAMIMAKYPVAPSK